MRARGRSLEMRVTWVNRPKKRDSICLAIGMLRASDLSWSVKIRGKEWVFLLFWNAWKRKDVWDSTQMLRRLDFGLLFSNKPQ